MLAQAHPRQPSDVEIHPEHRQPQLFPLPGVQGFEPLGHRLVGAQGVSGLGLRALGVPCLPDRAEHAPSWRVLPAQARVQQQAEHLRLGP